MENDTSLKPPTVPRPPVVLVGASGRIGQAVLHELVADHEVVVLTRSPTQSRLPHDDVPVTWRHCDLFSRTEVEAALEGARYVIYLVHSRVPSARLDQAQTEDLDLLIADNVGLGAARQGAQQIVCLRGASPREGMTEPARRREQEVPRALAGGGVAVTVVHAGLIVGPGGALMDLIERLLRRSPVLPVPPWAARAKQPIALIDVVRALCHAIGNPDLYGQRLDIGGPQVMDTRSLLETIAGALGRRPKVVSPPWLPGWLYAAWVWAVSPGSPRALRKLFVEGLANETVAGDNPLQRFVEQGATPIETALGHDPAHPPRSPRAAIRTADDALLRKARTVRSIQRYRCPPGRDATWLARNYFDWLGRFLWPVIVCDCRPDDSVDIAIRFPRIELLSLAFQPTHSEPGRRLYFIVGGMLASRREGTRGRMEFRDVLGGQCSIVAIHEFEPYLPWNFYHATQALAHDLVMRAYRRHVVGMGRG